MPTINWNKVSFDSEISEMRRIAEHFTPDKDTTRKQAVDGNLKYLRQHYTKSVPAILTNQIWSKLGNTDSWNTRTLSDVNKAILDNSKTSGMRDSTSIVMEYMSGVVRCPIVLQTEDGYTLIAGNTRLMVAKALGVIPKCVIIKTDW